jgi:hypothetical protein
MALSKRLVKAVLEPNTGEVFLFLLTFTNPKFNQPVRLVNNLSNIVSRGETYFAFPMEIVLPPDDGDTLPSVVINCSNVSLQLIDEIRSVNGMMDLKLELILANTANYIEASIENMRVAQIQYDKDSIQMTCTVDDLLNQAFPADKFTPGQWPGLFK